MQTKNVRAPVESEYRLTIPVKDRRPDRRNGQCTDRHKGGAVGHPFRCSAAVRWLSQLYDPSVPITAFTVSGTLRFRLPGQWLQRADSNRRPQGYDPCELPAALLCYVRSAAAQGGGVKVGMNYNEPHAAVVLVCEMFTD